MIDHTTRSGAPIDATPGRRRTWARSTAATCLVAVLLVAASVSFVPAAAADPLVVDTTIVALGGQPTDVEVDVPRGVAYVSLTDADEIVSVDLSTGTVDARHFMPDPAGMELSADGAYLYVALNSSTGIARVNLSDWSQTSVVLTELGDHRTWDVIEVSPGLVLVSANPSSSGLAYIVRYDFATGTEDRVADGRIIRAGPRFAMANADHVFIGAGFSPNSLYRLDLATPNFDIGAEDDHGSVSGTQAVAASSHHPGFVVIGSGQKIDTASITPIGSFEVGLPLFSDDGTLLYSYIQPDTYPRDDALISVSNAATTQLVEQWVPDCGTERFLRASPVFTKGQGSSDLLATTPDSLCIIHSDTARPAPPPPLPAGGRFFDDDDSIHENAIEAIAAAGITRGCNPPYQTGYCPNDPVTRQQMAAFLVRALGLTDTGSGNTFTDDDGSIFENDITKLATAGITKGCNPPDNTLFCPEAPVSRGQMAAFLVRAMGYTDIGDGDLFTDDDNSVFESNIDRLATAGITKGCNPPANTRFCPDQLLTRAEMATFLARAMSLQIRSVPPRPETISGISLAVIRASESAGCLGTDGETCDITKDLSGEFHLDVGWFLDDWSSLSATEQSQFKSSKVGMRASFDNVPLDVVVWPFDIVDDTGYKAYTYQFPSWLTGTHVLELVFFDEFDDYEWTLRATLNTTGPGYAQSKPDAMVTEDQSLGALFDSDQPEAEYKRWHASG